MGSAVAGRMQPHTLEIRKQANVSSDEEEEDIKAQQEQEKQDRRQHHRILTKKPPVVQVLSSEQIKELTSTFRLIDVDEDGFITLDQLCLFYDIQYTPYLDSIFKKQGQSTEGVSPGRERAQLRMINMHEYLLGLWLFMSRTKDSLIEFQFEVYAEDHGNWLTRGGFLQILEGAYFGSASVGRDSSASTITSKLMQTELLSGILGHVLPHADIVDPDIKFSFDVYDEAVQLSPRILKPVLRLQDRFRESHFGQAFWVSTIVRKNICSATLYEANVCPTPVDILRLSTRSSSVSVRSHTRTKADTHTHSSDQHNIPQYDASASASASAAAVVGLGAGV